MNTLWCCQYCMGMAAAMPCPEMAWSISNPAPRPLLGLEVSSNCWMRTRRGEGCPCHTSWPFSKHGCADHLSINFLIVRLGRQGMGNQGYFAPCSLSLVPFAGYRSNSAVSLKIKSAHALQPSNSVTHYPSLKKHSCVSIKRSTRGCLPEHCL